MRIATTGSIAFDHLMRYQGRFAEQLIADRLDKVSLSFLAESLDVRHGGTAANIAYGLGVLGLRPVLVGAAGTDFGAYAEVLRGVGVDLGSVRISEDRYTARFVCTTDRDDNQIATFYPGAMVEAADISLLRVAERTGGLDLCVVSPDDPEAMLRHTAEAHSLGVPFAADPSQQLAVLTRPQVRSLVDGARFLFCNEYESALLLERSGWTEEQVLSCVGTWVVTLGADGVQLRQEGLPPLTVPAVAGARAVDPTGVGDAFRAGFLAGMARTNRAEHAARLGCAVAAVVLETLGPQGWSIVPSELYEQVAS